MLNDKVSDKLSSGSPSLSDFKSGLKVRSRLSLKLHTMPKTSDSHFKKWLILGVLMAGLMILIAVLALW